MDTQPSPLEDAVFGAVSGVAGKLVEFPFDTIKVRMQTQLHSTSTRTLSASASASAWNTALAGVREGGLLSLYRGLSAPLAGSMAETSILFAAYAAAQDSCRSLLSLNTKDELPLPLLCLCGSFSGVAASFLLTPVELIKCRLQVSPCGDSNAGSTSSIRSTSNTHITTTKGFSGPLDVVRATLRAQGLRGLYRGHTATMLREFFGTAAWFGTYEAATAHFVAADGLSSKSELAAWKLAAAGALAGVVFNGSVFPADAVKSVMQTASLDHKRGFVMTFKDLLRARGVRGLYAGCGITLLRAAPTSAAIFATYEWLARTCSGTFR